MNEWQARALLDEFIVGQQQAFAAFTVALARVIDRDQLAEQLRIQVTTHPERGTANPVRDALLRAAWEAVRHPLPLER